MNETRWIKSLDQPYRAPQVDVASDVLREIRRRERDRGDTFPLAALLATLVGSGSVAMAMMVWLDFADPLAHFMDSFKLVLQ